MMPRHPFLFRMPGVAALALLLTACSSGTENARPDPVDLSQFGKGTTRFTVIGAVGNPQGSVTQPNTRRCDIYQLYTSGLSAGGKAAMAAGETVTDIATLGLAEIVWTPVHAGTRPRIHTVLFCYDDAQHLVELFDKDPSESRQARHVIVDPEAYSRPIVLKAAPPTDRASAADATPVPALPSTAPANAATGPAIPTDPDAL